MNPELAKHPTLAGSAERGWLSYPEFRTLEDNAGAVFAALGLLRVGREGGGIIVRAGDGEPELVRVGGTNVALFSRVLRVAPVVGRLFSIDDETAAEEEAVLITEGFWRRRFGADPRAIGSTIYFEEYPRTVVGVLPEEAALPGQAVEIWTLWGADDDWEDHHLIAIGRLAAGVTAERAAERLSGVLAAALPADHDGRHGVNVIPRRADEAQGVRAQLGLFALGSLLLLVVACVNVAALTLSAGIGREKELAVRSALGAGRGTLARQLMAESVLIGLAAAVIGAALAGLGTRAVVWLAPAGVPRISEAVLDGRALVFAVALSVACGWLFGLVPSLRLARRGLRASIGSGERGAAAQRALVTAELTLATVLLVGAGLLTRTLHALNTVDLGFAARETLALRLTAPDERLFAGVNFSDPAEVASSLDRFYAPIEEALESLPGVRGVAITSNLPLTSDGETDTVIPEGFEGPELVAASRFVSPNYFGVVGMRMVEGRPFVAAEDRSGAPGTVVVSESLARAAWPGASPLGKRIRFMHSETPATVVGVAADVHDEDVRAGTAFAYYLPRRQANRLGGSIVVRTEGDAAAIVRAVRERIREVDPAVVVNFATPLSDLASTQIAGERYRARLIGAFSALAGLLSLMGVYGVTVRRVASRRRELGVRSALGARQSGLIGFVLAESMRLAALGAGAGVVVALLLARGMEAYLWGVQPTDLLTLIGTGTLVASASLVAAVVPALRAARIDPVEALRHE
jgi:predicted permease